MAPVIELFGAPGTGKSSLVRALDGRRVAGRRLVDARRLTRIPRGGMLGRIRRRDLTPTERREALRARREDWGDLLALAAAAPRVLSLTTDPLRALQAPGWLATTLELRALADAAPDDLVVVLDEGLVQRASIVCGPAPDDAALAAYLGALPPTALAVQTTVEHETLLARVMGRERTIDRHVGLDATALRASLAEDVALADRCTRRLAELGAPTAVVATDASDPAGTVVEQIRAALSCG